MAGKHRVAMMAVVVFTSAACGSPAVYASAVASAMPAMVLAGMDAGRDVAGAAVRLLDGQASVHARFGTVGVLRNEDAGISCLTCNGDASTVGWRWITSA